MIKCCSILAVFCFIPQFVRLHSENTLQLWTWLKLHFLVIAAEYMRNCMRCGHWPTHISPRKNGYLYTPCIKGQKNCLWIKRKCVNIKCLCSDRCYSSSTAQQTAAGGFCNSVTPPGQRLSMKTRWTLTSPPLCMWRLHVPGSKNNKQKATREIRTSKQWHHSPGELILIILHSVTAAFHKMPPCPIFLVHISQQQPLNTHCPESAGVDEWKNGLRFSVWPKTCFGASVCLHLFSWKLWWHIYNLSASGHHSLLMLRHFSRPSWISHSPNPDKLNSIALQTRLLVKMEVRLEPNIIPGTGFHFIDLEWTWNQ